EQPQDAAVRLEVNEWNGSVEARLVLCALCPTETGRCELVDIPFWDAIEAELERDPAVWRPAEGAPVRQSRDRRGAAFAGLAGDLLSSGEGVLVVCADAARRAPALEPLIGGLARGGARLALASWDALATRPDLAEPFDHLVALDPPPAPAGEGLVGYLAWGPAEVEYALAAARAGLELREPLAELYRALRDARTLAGDELERALRGDGAHPRSPALCGRLVRVLVELGHGAYEGRGCRFVETNPVGIESSAAYRAYRERLAGAERYLAGLRTALAA